MLNTKATKLAPITEYNNTLVYYGSRMVDE